MPDDVWKDFADLLADLFAKYGSKLLQIEAEKDNIDLSNKEQDNRKEKGE